MPAAQRRLSGEPKARPGLFYLAAFMPGLVWHIGDLSVAGNQLHSSRRLEFLAVPVSSLSHVPIYCFLALSGYFGAATPAGV